MKNNLHLRHGIACAGNWIVDYVKRVDCLPSRGMLGNIREQSIGSGGAPFNVLVDLARMQAPFPLAGFGVTGQDAGHEFIRRFCAKLKIDLSDLTVDPSASTSYTDVMTDIANGDRVFYHYRGANAHFGPEHVPPEKLACRIFHLGYLLLLDRLDQADPEFGTGAARLLHSIQQQGIKTSLDVVSEESDRFHTIVPPALNYTNYLICNEIEAGRTVGLTVRDANGQLDRAALREALDRLLTLGNMDLVAVHMPEGACLKTRSGQLYARGSLALPQGYIISAVGAGDAFCAGMLYALHENWELADALGLASWAAAAVLAQAGATDGMLPLDKLRELGQRYPEREPPL